MAAAHGSGARGEPSLCLRVGGWRRAVGSLLSGHRETLCARPQEACQQRRLAFAMNPLWPLHARTGRLGPRTGCARARTSVAAGARTLPHQQALLRGRRKSPVKPTRVDQPAQHVHPSACARRARRRTHPRRGRSRAGAVHERLSGSHQRGGARPGRWEGPGYRGGEVRGPRRPCLRAR